MNRYLVTSDNFAVSRDSELTEEQLIGYNVPALVAGGHLCAMTDSPSTPEALEAPVSTPEAAPTAATEEPV